MTTLGSELLSNLSPGDRLSDQHCAVSSVEHVRTPTFQFISMTLSDRSGEARAILLSFDNESYQKLQSADLSRVWGFVDTKPKYRGQITIESFAELHADADISQFLQPLPPNHDAQVDKINQLIDSIENPWLSELLNRIFDDTASTWDQFAGAVAAKNMHHAFRGGLLEHSVEVASLCSSAADTLTAVNRDLLAPRPGQDRRDRSRAPQRRVYATREFGRTRGFRDVRVRRVMDSIDGFPAPLKDDVCHLILSHHGSHEYGAARLPSTPEAVILACCDAMSARVYQLNDTTQRVWDNKMLLPTGGV